MPATHENAGDILRTTRLILQPKSKKAPPQHHEALGRGQGHRGGHQETTGKQRTSGAAPGGAKQRPAGFQGFARVTGGGGESGELNPSRCIEDDKIWSIQAGKSGTGLSITWAGSGGRSTGSGCAQSHRAGVLVQPASQIINALIAVSQAGLQVIGFPHQVSGQDGLSGAGALHSAGQLLGLVALHVGQRGAGLRGLGKSALAPGFRHQHQGGQSHHGGRIGPVGHQAQHVQQLAHGQAPYTKARARA